jgi:hypothetical protein|nr:MAG TPA: homing endonuclease [Caudoviricetes sp.]
MNENLFYKNRKDALLEGEVWMPITGYYKRYYVSNMDRLKSVKKNKEVCILAQKERMYLKIALSINGTKRFYQVHRLVAIAFVQNTENKPCVNHIDGNKYNNIASNLEWCTLKENSQHSFHILGNIPPLGFKYLFNQFGVNNQRARAVVQMKDGKIIAEYSCINEATQKTGIIHSGISRCCNGKQRISKGFEWRYK